MSSAAPAAALVRKRLGLAARRLGTANPTAAIGGLIDRSFSLPVGDSRYECNQLVPGALPIEHSFSELDKQSLRLVMEPLGPDAAPIARRDETSREVRKLVKAAYGGDALKWFDKRSEAWRGSSIDGAARFGGWFGGSFGPEGPRRVKAYYEMTPDQIDSLPPNLQHAARVAMHTLPGLVPVFASVTCGPRAGAVRVYFFHRGALRLLDLEPLMNRLGVGRQLPGLLTALGLILGGRFEIPDGALVLGLRDTQRGIEMKLEVLLGAFPDPPRQMHGLIQMHLAQRPESHRALEHWLQAMTPDDHPSPGSISVVGVRVRPDMGARLNVYFRPVGYERDPSTSRRGADALRSVASTSL